MTFSLSASPARVRRHDQVLTFGLDGCDVGALEKIDAIGKEARAQGGRAVGMQVREELTTGEKAHRRSEAAAGLGEGDCGAVATNHGEPFRNAGKGKDRIGGQQLMRRHALPGGSRRGAAGRQDEAAGGDGEAASREAARAGEARLALDHADAGGRQPARVCARRGSAARLRDAAHRRGPAVGRVDVAQDGEPAGQVMGPEPGPRSPHQDDRKAACDQREGHGMAPGIVADDAGVDGEGGEAGIGRGHAAIHRSRPRRCREGMRAIRNLATQPASRICRMGVAWAS